MPRKGANECTTCGEWFGSVKAFDHHRRGEFPQTGPSEYLDRLRAGLLPDHDEWQPEFGRRCLEVDEMEADPHMARNSYGEWSLADSLVYARNLRSEEAQSGMKVGV